jgi:hypothetical protein
MAVFEIGFERMHIVGQMPFHADVRRWRKTG